MALPVIGGLVGVLIVMVIVWVRPPQVDPLVALARIDAAHHGHQPSRSGPRDLPVRVGRAVSELLDRHGVRGTSLRQDYALTGQSYDAAMGRKVTLALAGFLLGLVMAVGVTATGLALPVGTWLLAAVGVGAVFCTIPDIDARTAARRRRAEFTRALGAYLDWVSLQMAGQAAAEQALPDAARLGHSWPLTLIRQTLTHATRSGQDSWTALAELGERIGVTHLIELGALVRLIAHDGARVRDTLTARAASIRAEELADAQGDAGRRDQSMLLAQVLLGVGFAVFLGYPAVVTFLHL